MKQRAKTKEQLLNELTALQQRITELEKTVAERKQMEETLKKSQSNYEALVASVEGIVWEADTCTFQFSFVSQQAERLLGYPIERWLSEPTFWQDHLHPEDREWTVAFCQRATSEKRDHELEYRMIAADGKVAQGMIEQKQYDLFLVDIRTPAMSGKELYQWLQDKYPALTCRVIFTTGNVMGNNTQRFLNQTARSFLPKPFTPDDLKAVVREALQHIKREDKP